MWKKSQPVARTRDSCGEKTEGIALSISGPGESASGITNECGYGAAPPPTSNFVPRGWSAGAGGSSCYSPKPQASRASPRLTVGRASTSVLGPPPGPPPSPLASPREHRPIFCALAFLGCAAGFTFEIRQNGWAFQPFWCGTCENGAPCNEDGTPCEANILFGPTYATMLACGGKMDEKIFEEGEWWRVLSCNWLHGGLFHLLMNMLALWNLGVPLERVFGWWRIGSLYIVSGIFGTMVSVVFLPNVLSVGASASVFGLIGACWADVVLNHCARCTLRGANLCALFLSTLVNVLIGLTPLVDNFMHMGGMVAGLTVGCILFSRRHPDARGVLRYRACQRNIMCVAVLAFGALFLATLAFAASPATQRLFRSCSFCDHINCVEPSFLTGTPWWDCDLTATNRFACALPDPAAADKLLCFCTSTPSCNATLADDPASAHGSCEIGVAGCARGDATWCSEFCR